MREQIFHAWRWFHFNENSWIIDSYVVCIRQKAALLGYDKPQALKVFKNKCQSRLHWFLFPIEDLRQAVGTAKRILTKEKIKRQLVGQWT